MKDINQQLRTTFVFSTHDKKVMSKADRLVRIEDGSITSLAVRRDNQWVRVRSGQRDLAFDRVASSGERAR